MKTLIVLGALATGQVLGFGLSLIKVRDIGVADGPAPYVFGLLQDVTRDDRGNLYVLDSRLNEMRVFDERGLFVAAAGRPGRGPAEFSVPASISFESLSREVYVLDRGNQRVSRFESKTGSVQYAGSFNLDFAATDMCLLGGEVYLLGYRDEGGILHRFSGDGRRIRSFGEVPHAEHPVLSRSLARGRIACDPARQLIFLTPLLSPQVEAYSTDGRRLWSTTLRGYRGVSITQNLNGSITFKSDQDGGYHVAASLVVMPGGYAMVQWGLIDAESRTTEDFRSIETRFIDTATGKEVGSDHDLPRLVDADGSVAVGVDNSLVPTLTIFRVRSAGPRAERR